MKMHGPKNKITILELEGYALFTFLSTVRCYTGKQNNTEDVYFYIQRTYLHL